jgi:zinc transport system ATP-binding protein
MRDPLPAGVTLRVLRDGMVIFTSGGRWLHPLFELERFLRERGEDGSGCEVRDKVVGRGSAFLLVRLGVRAAHAELLSRLGRDVLERAGVAATWDTLVERIQCATESLLERETDVEAAYALLAERAARARERGRT